MMVLVMCIDTGSHSTALAIGEEQHFGRKVVIILTLFFQAIYLKVIYFPIF